MHPILVSFPSRDRRVMHLVNREIDHCRADLSSPESSTHNVNPHALFSADQMTSIISTFQKMMRRPTPSASGGNSITSPSPPLPGSGKPGGGPRILIIGGGSRGSAYAHAIHSSSIGTVVGIAEPIEYKRNLFISKYAIARDDLVFSSWTGIVETEEVKEKIKREVDGICVCTLDETHAEV